MKQYQQRIDWVDFLKGFCILWLVVYHFYVFDWLRSPVPVFFCLSGLFYSDRLALSAFVKKKSNQLLVPFLFFFLLGVLSTEIAMLLHLCSGYNISRLMYFFTLIPKDSDIQNPLGVGAIWYLLSLYEIYMLYYLLRRITKNEIVLFGISILLLLVSEFFLTKYAMGSLFYIPYTLQFFFYFVSANLLKEYIFKGQFSVRLLFGAVILYLFRFIEMKCYSTVISDLLAKLSEVGLLIILVYFARCLSVLIDSSNTFCRGGKVLYTNVLRCGKNSLSILGTHSILMSVTHRLLMKIIHYDIVLYSLSFLIIIICTNICSCIFNRYVPFLIGKSNKK